MQSLPIDPLLPEIIARLRQSPNIVLEAPPGAGKTTRVPPALLDASLAGSGEVLVLEPRRLAARMAARRVAEERGEKLGETVGYQVRFEEVAGPRTRLRFLTEGVLTRRLLSDPKLKNVGVVVLDEFHERHLQADLALALLRRLQKTERPDLKLAVMSATLDAGPVARYLDDAPTLRSEGKRFDISIEHLARPDERPLAEQVATAVNQLVAKNHDGDILVFLPGAAEIRRAQAACASIADRRDLMVLPLHGDLSAEEQDRAVKPGPSRKVILSTNVAESSVTIDGVVAVIDSGLARVAVHSPWSGLPTLNVARISKASATQRAGRAGRTRPGWCLRLYSAQDFNARPDHDAAEVHHADLAETALELHAAGVADLSGFNWFEPPPQSALEAAESLLAQLGAIDARGEVTPVGKRMLRFPLHPRQSRMLVEAQSRGVGEQATVTAALIGERDIIASELFKNERERKARQVGPSDLLHRLDLFEEAAAANFAPSRLREMNLDVGAVMAVNRVNRQLQRMRVAAGIRLEDQKSAGSGERENRREGNRRSGRTGERENGGAGDESLLISILAGYPDRVAKRRALKSENRELLLSGGGAAQLSPSSVVGQSEFMVAIDAEERRDANQARTRVVRIASMIEPDWLIDLFADRIRETTEAKWNAQSERVEVVERMMYDQLSISENRSNTAGREEAARVLAEAALTTGLQRFVEPETVANFLARVEFVAKTFPESSTPVLNDDDVREALLALCDGLKSFAELRASAGDSGGSGLIEALRRRLNSEQQRLLDKMAPEFVAIAGRRRVRVNYETGKPPWIESRLQDFFGMKTGPVIAGGRAPVVLHLLAPNRRPVQVTTDLAGFWQRVYPQVRKELSRRYPRHAWPENPLEI
ncbi:MAG TPA: ATP-dependent helicase C-terminal domain-containing protein [Blastocatellia bacterium]|nr:ATP-dependent helicase C-terminal domain-containing protein [Blastocatellia bacterium]